MHEEEVDQEVRVFGSSIVHEIKMAGERLMHSLRLVAQNNADQEEAKVSTEAPTVHRFYDSPSAFKYRHRLVRMNPRRHPGLYLVQDIIGKKSVHPSSSKH